MKMRPLSLSTETVDLVVPPKPKAADDGISMHIAASEEGLRPSVLLAAACLLLLSCLLLVPPTLGIADNGDYARIMVFFDLTHAPKEWGDRYFGHLNPSYVFDGVESRKYAAPDFPCSALLFTGIAVGINSLFRNQGFNLLILGALQCVVFALAVFWMSVATRQYRGTFRTVTALLAIIVFTDIAYSAYLNSFYGEAASLLFFLLVLASGFQVCTAQRRLILWTGVYIACSAGFLLAKYQNLLLLPFVLVFAWRALARYAGVAASRLFLMAALVLCYAGYRFWLSSPASVNEAVLYNSVFNGVLVDSASPERDLEELGLDPTWVKYAGSTAFQPTSLRFQPEFAQYFIKKINVTTLFRFYLKRPARLWSAMRRGLQYSYTMRPPESGNYQKSAGHPPGTKSNTWAMWSTARIALLPPSLLFLFLLIAAYLAILIREWRSNDAPALRLAIDLGFTIPAMAMLQLLLISITDGVGDLVKHGFLFNMFVDVMLVVLIAYACSLWMNHHSKAKVPQLVTSERTAK